MQVSQAAGAAAADRQPIYLSLPLLILLSLALFGAVTFERLEWPAFVGDEATYLMAGESLAWDLDLRFGPEDYARFVKHWGRAPEGLILLSGDQGEHITFGKPFFYPLIIAPWQRVSPVRGPFVANALVLALAGLMTVRSLKTRFGRVAWLWVAAFLFASVSFAYVYWAHADLFLMALTAMALSLAFEVPGSTAKQVSGLRWAVIGALVAVVIFSRPLYAPILVPVAMSVARGQRRRGLGGLLVGVGLVVLSAVAIHWISGRSLTSYGAQRRGFYSSTGFPGVDFAPQEWVDKLEEFGDAAWVEGQGVTKLPETSASLWAWNSLYFLIGRHAGVLPYFLPLLLGFLARPRGPVQWTLVGAVLICVAGFFLFRPFNFYGGGGAIANRYFLPLFPALWFLGTRRVRLVPPLVLIGVAAVFLWPLWSQPRAFPLRQNSTYRYVSPIARRVLPFETTQSHLKPSGQSDVVHHQLWIKLLDPTLRASRDGDVLQLRGEARGQLLIGSPRPLTGLYLATWGPDAERLEVTGGATITRDEVVDGTRRLTLELSRRRARHAMWWTWDPIYLYQLGLEAGRTGDGRLPFSLSRRGMESSGEDDS